MRITLSSALAISVVAACGTKATKDPGPGSSTPASGSSGSSVAGTATREDRIVLKDIGLSTPESVMYDADADVYLVANINGKPADADDNGFISKLSPEGRVLELKWIDGAKPDVKLDAPKGMVIAEGVLWVADITVVRKFDAKTGKPMGEVKIEGASFLNDVAATPDGTIYVTDTGMNSKLEATGSDAVYRIAKGDKVTPLVKSKQLGKPNGVIVVDGVVWVVTFGSGEIFAVNAKGEKQPATKLPKGQLDGIVFAHDKLIVSSWEGKTVYVGIPGAWKDLKLDIAAPADIGWDGKRDKLLVPHFQDNAITILGI